MKKKICVSLFLCLTMAVQLLPVFQVSAKETVKIGTIASEDDCPSGATHEWKAIWYEAELSCTSPTDVVYKCQKCGQTKTETVPPISHSHYTAWAVRKKATHFKTGIKYRKCGVCGIEETAPIAKRAYTANEKKALTATKKMMNLVKKYDYTGMKKYRAGTGFRYSYWPKNNKVTYQIVKKEYKQNFYYEITNVYPSGKNIKVKIKIAYPSAYKQYQKACKEVSPSYKKALLAKSPSDKALKYFQKLVIKRVKKYGTELRTKTYTFTVKKTAKGWKIIKADKILPMNMDILSYKKL